MTDEPESTDIIVSGAESAPLMDFGGGQNLPDVQTQDAFLTQFDERRAHFQKWLMQHLVEGVHYGYPPGCEVRLDEDGNIIQRVFDRRANRYVEKTVPRQQWRSKPTLYKAGALLLLDLLGLRAEYESDMETWRMAGEPKGSFYRKCILRNPGTGEIIGEGTGCFKIGDKKMDENSAIKMADKRAAVAAVVNRVPIVADLFTQDMENPPKSGATTADSRPQEKLGEPQDEGEHSEDGEELADARAALWQEYKPQIEEAGGKARVVFKKIVEDVLGEGANAENLDDVKKLREAMPQYDLASGDRVPDGDLFDDSPPANGH